MEEPENDFVKYAFDALVPRDKGDLDCDLLLVYRGLSVFMGPLLAVYTQTKRRLTKLLSDNFDLSGRGTLDYDQIRKSKKSVQALVEGAPRFKRGNRPMFSTKDLLVIITSTVEFLDAMKPALHLLGSPPLLHALLDKRDNDCNEKLIRLAYSKQIIDTEVDQFHFDRLRFSDDEAHFHTDLQSILHSERDAVWSEQLWCDKELSPSFQARMARFSMRLARPDVKTRVGSIFKSPDALKLLAWEPGSNSSCQSLAEDPRVKSELTRSSRLTPLAWSVNHSSLEHLGLSESDAELLYEGEPTEPAVAEPSEGSWTMIESQPQYEDSGLKVQD